MAFPVITPAILACPGFFSTGLAYKVLSSVIVLELGWIAYCRLLHPFSDIPGPFLASFSRLWIARSVAGGRAEHTQRELHRKYGPLVRIAPNEVAVADPAAIKIIYNIKSGFTKTDFYPPFAPNISPHGDHFSQLSESKHAERRKYVNSVYSMSTILGSEEYINACSDVFLEKMGKYAEQGPVIDFGEWIQWYTFDVIGELFFGQQFGFMRDEHDYCHYVESLDTLLPGTALSCVLPAYLRPFHSSLGKFWTDTRLEQMQTQAVTRVDLLDKFFKIRENKSGWDIPDIQNEACVAIFAGSDTTAIAIRSIFYHLMKNKAAMEKLVAEIDDFDSRGLLGRPHYPDTIKKPPMSCVA